MNAIVAVVVGICAVFLLGLAVALYLVATPPPPIFEPKDVFDFTSLRMGPAEIPPPSLRRYAARDGEELAYRIYIVDLGPHPHFRSRLVLSRRRLSRAGRCPEPWRSGEGRVAQYARPLSVGAASRRCRIHRPDGRRYGRPDQAPSRTASQRPDHARRPFQWWRFRDPLRRGRPGRAYIELSAARSGHSNVACNAAGNGGWDGPA